LKRGAQTSTDAGAGEEEGGYERYKLKKPAVPTHCVYCNPKLGDPPEGWVEGEADVVPPFEFHSPDAVDWDTEGVWSFEAPLIQQPLYVNRERWRLLPTSILYIPYLEAMEEDPHRVFVQQLYTHQVLSVHDTLLAHTLTVPMLLYTHRDVRKRSIYTVSQLTARARQLYSKWVDETLGGDGECKVNLEAAVYSRLAFAIHYGLLSLIKTPKSEAEW